MWKQGTAEIRHTGGPIAWAASAPHRQELFACHAASPLPSNEPAELTACDNGSNWKQITHLHQAGNVIPVTGLFTANGRIRGDPDLWSKALAMKQGLAMALLLHGVPGL